MLANSRGFVGGYRTSYAGVSAAPLAVDANGHMQRDSWWSGARRIGGLESPESVGKEAARRTVRRLGATRVPTQQVPIVFAPEVARSLIGSVFDAASGDAIWRQASFLAGKLGETHRRPQPHHHRRQRHAPRFRRGRLRHLAVRRRGPPFAAHHRWWNKACSATTCSTPTPPASWACKSTHNASRGLAGTPGIGAGNLYLEPGALTPEEIIAAIPAGLYVTSLMGFGVNLVTGDYSRGATGLWIENGELTHAVEEVTIAGNLADMLRNVTAIGNDLVFRGSVASPTLRIDGMTIAGA